MLRPEVTQKVLGYESQYIQVIKAKIIKKKPTNKHEPSIESNFHKKHSENYMNLSRLTRHYPFRIECRGKFKIDIL